MLIFKHMCVASDSRTTVVAMLLLVENEYELCITVRSLGVSGVTRISDKGVATPCFSAAFLCAFTVVRAMACSQILSKIIL